MGWYFTYQKKQDLIDDLLGSIEGIKKFNYETQEYEPCEPYSVRVLNHHMGKDGLWALRERVQGKSKKVFITLDLIDAQNGLWGHKPMDETMGPCFYDCPIAFLDQSPDPGGYATAWREKVRKQL